MKRLQNKIAESKLALPLTLLVTALAWVGAGALSDIPTGIGLLMVVVSSSLMALLNNRYALMHTYSRMASCALLVLTCCCLPLFIDMDGTLGMATGCLLVATYHALFATYQNREATQPTFAAFACIALISLFRPQVLFFVPVVWLLMNACMMSLSPRTLVASVLGLLFPYWILSGWVFIERRTDWLTAWWQQAISFQPLADIDTWPLSLLLPGALIILLFLTGTIHCLRNSGQQNIKTRMFYRVFIIMGFASLVFLALQPQQASWLLPMLIVNTAPLIARYITFTHTRLTNVSVIIILAMAAGSILYHVWQLS